jgi:putative acetyltransferase
MRLRPAAQSDASDIRTVHLLAFPTAAEADLVEQLVRDGDAPISIVALEDRRIVGHVLFSRMDVVADGRLVNALGLAPVAVLPDRTGRGIGSALIEAGIAEAARIGADAIFVLGDTDFYGRFGFKAEAALPFVSPYAGAHFQALMLNQSLASVVTGSARYARAFAEL